MKMFVCKVCGHIEFNQAPEKCPVCFAGKEAFNEDATAIKEPDNPNELSEGDKKHIPQIVINRDCGLISGGSCTDVHVKVGEIEHVMTPEHFIMHVDFYIDHTYVSRVMLSAGTCQPAAGLHLSIEKGRLTTIESCNVHGNWMAEIDL